MTIELRSVIEFVLEEADTAYSDAKRLLDKRGDEIGNHFALLSAIEALNNASSYLYDCLDGVGLLPFRKNLNDYKHEINRETMRFEKVE